jgi:D-alanyl-D-alanine carboxypeptidase
MTEACMTKRWLPSLPVAVLGLTAGTLIAPAVGPRAVAAAARSASAADAALDRALRELVAMPGGPPSATAIVQRGSLLRVHAFGVAAVGEPGRPRKTDSMRIASVAKAFSGAVALSLAGSGVLSLDDTIGQRLPGQPVAWHAVTLRQLLAHTSGLPDFTEDAAFQKAVLSSLTVAPPPAALLAFVAHKPLNFAPGTQYRYSNSDNVAVGLMVEAATGRSYEEALRVNVTKPLRLSRTSLPAGPEVPPPLIHGYDFADDGTPEDQSEIFASGWAWASGGIISTPADLNRFIRGYVGGRLFGRRMRAQQRRWAPSGGSEPPGPGTNAAGLALFRYRTRCGTVLGHTGNTFGFTQFAAATADGTRSTTVSISLQRTQKDQGWRLAVFEALRAAEEQAVCAALATGK